MSTTIQLLIPDPNVAVSSDGRGTYSCDYCGREWQAGKRYLYWPLHLKWVPPLMSRADYKRAGMKPRRTFFVTHGWQVGWDGIEQRVYCWTLHLGSLKVNFGSKDFEQGRSVSACCLSRPC